MPRPVLVVRIGRGDGRGDLRHLRLSLVERHIRFQPCDALVPAQRAGPAPAAPTILRTRRPQRPEICRLGRSGWIREAGRHDAGDRVGLAIEREGAADGRGIATEVPLPEIVAQHDHAVIAGDGIA